MVKQKFFSAQITYWSGSLPKADSQDKASLSGHDLKSANYVSMRAAKSNQYMVYVLCILSSNVDKGPDEPAVSKKLLLDTIGQNIKESWRLSIICLWKMALGR